MPAAQLTRKARYQGIDVPMSGIPVHALDAYLQRFVAKGLCVGQPLPASCRRA